MKIEFVPRHESHSRSEQLPPPPAQREVVPVDWTESEWFNVWLKLARHEQDVQEVAC